MDAIVERFFEMTRDLLCVAGFDGRLRRVNPAWTRKLQYSQTELVGMPYLDLFHPDDRAAVRRHVEGVAGGAPLPMLEARLHRRDGAYIHFLWSAIAIPEHSVLVATGKDITASKRIEVALRDSERMFRSVTECAADAIVTTDETGMIRSWNGSAQRMFGYSPDEVLGQPLTILMPVRYRHAHMAGLERFLGGAPPQVIGRRVELHALRKDGEEFPIELSLTTWIGASGRHFTGVLRDLSDRKR